MVLTCEVGEGRIGGGGAEVGYRRGKCRGFCGGRYIVVILLCCVVFVGSGVGLALVIVVEMIVASGECRTGFDVFFKGEVGRSQRIGWPEG